MLGNQISWRQHRREFKKTVLNMSTWYEKAAGDIYEAVGPWSQRNCSQNRQHALVMLTKMVESGDGGSSSMGFTSEGDKVRPRVLST